MTWLRKWLWQRRLYAALPDLKIIDRAIRDNRRDHKPVKLLQAEKRRILHAALAGRV